MGVYITLGKYTREGVMKIKEHPQRLEEAKKVLASVGAKLQAFYMTFGQYDFVAIVEGPDDDESVLKAILMISSLGSVSLQTLEAIPAERVTQIVQTLP